MEITKLALDTNIWIYLTKPSYSVLLEKLKNGNHKDFDVIVNDIVIKEWDRNKENTRKTLVENIKNEANSAFHIIDFLDNDEERENLKAIIQEYKTKENARIKAADACIEEVENFMKSCTQLEAIAEQIEFVSHLAINKIPPLHTSKNNFNDALIIRNFAEYSKSDLPYKYDMIFVSNNPKDFLDSNTGDVYKELLDGIEVKMKSVKELGEALEIAPDLIDDFDDWLESELSYRAELEYEISKGK